MSEDQSQDLGSSSRLVGDQGANLVEYAMLIALIVLVCLAAMQAFGKNATNKMSCAASTINSASPGVTC